MASCCVSHMKWVLFIYCAYALIIIFSIILLIVKCPDVCLYEVVSYNITIINTLTGVVIVNQTTTTCANFSTVIELPNTLTQYNVSVVVSNEAKQSYITSDKLGKKLI